MRLPQSESTSADALNSGSEQLAGFFVVSHPIWQRWAGFTVTHGQGSACSPGGLRGRCGALGRPPPQRSPQPATSASPRLTLLFWGNSPPPARGEDGEDGEGQTGGLGGGGRYARGEIDAGARDQSNPAGGWGVGRGSRLGNESRRRAGIPLASGHRGGRTSDNSHTSAEIGLGGLGWGEGVWSRRGGWGGGGTMLFASSRFYWLGKRM